MIPLHIYGKAFMKMANRYKLDIQGVIHIGAHYGQEYSAYVRLGVKNMMFFEPVVVRKRGVYGIDRDAQRFIENRGQGVYMVQMRMRNEPGMDMIASVSNELSEIACISFCASVNYDDLIAGYLDHIAVHL